MDHVLIDTRDWSFVGRGLYHECINAREHLDGFHRYNVVDCSAARGFAQYPKDTLNKIWLRAKGWTTAPLVSYGTMCKAVQEEAQKVGLISVVMSKLNEEHEMSNAAPEQNGVKWPQRGASARVFEIAQTLSTQKGDFIGKDEVVAAAVAEGINAGTAGTQYSAWLRYWQGPSAPEAAAPAAPVAPVAPVAPAAPVAPVSPAVAPHPLGNIPPVATQGIQAAQQAAPAQFQTPAAPAFAAPAAPVHHAPPSQPFAQPAVAQEVAVAGAETQQGMSVAVGMNLSINFDQAIQKAERLVQLLQDAKADLGD